MLLRDDVVLGLDIGIGSIGWALVEQPQDEFALCKGNNIPSLGSRAFDIPENPKKELLNVHRRTMRQQRVTSRRRRRRIKAVRSLLVRHGLLDSTSPTSFLHHATDPWLLRKGGLDRLLGKTEFAAVLLHMAKHRGFESTSKREGKDNDTGKMLAAVGTLRERMAKANAPTVGAYMADLPRKRNRKGPDGTPVYEHTVLRALLKEELDLLFTRQRELGNDAASDALKEEFAAIAFRRRPLKSVEDIIGACPFEPDEKRASKYAYTSELFRLAQRLTTIRIRQPQGPVRPLTPHEIHKALSLLGKTKKVSYSAVRKLLDLPQESFEGLPYGAKDKNGKPVDPEAADIVSRTSGCSEGTRTFILVLGEDAFNSLRERRTPAGTRVLDALAWIISVNDDLAIIHQDTAALGLTPGLHDTVMRAVREGTFKNFRGTMHLSLKAMEKIIPFMIEHVDYSAGCDMAGYDHTTQAEALSKVRNPVVQKVLSELRRQFRTIVNEHGIIPGRIHVELLRDMGKGPKERKEIDAGIKKRTDQKKDHRKHCAALLGITPDDVSQTELTRYELWKAQGGKCAYYMLWRNAGGERCYAGEHVQGAISPAQLRDGANAAQIDHILPRSRTFDNSFHNLCLCCISANQAKAGQTPWEWIGRHNPDAWHEFKTWVAGLKVPGFKKRNFCLKNLDEEMQGKFHARNLNDSRYAARLAMRVLAEEYERLGVPSVRPDGTGIRRIFSRPGSLTYQLRRSWGVDELKKDAEGNRLGDRHHALDALVVACCTERLLQSMTRSYKRMETWQDRYGIIPDVLPPWPGFRQDAARELQGVFVSRAERGGAGGALHEDTLRQIRTEQNEKNQPVEVLYERKYVSSLTEKDLENIKDVERNALLKETLEQWIKKGKPKDDPPTYPIRDAKTGEITRRDVIRRVLVRRGPFQSGVVLTRGGGKAQADNGKIVRTDVFGKDGKFYLVPIYTSQMNADTPPNRATIAYKQEADWHVMDDGHEFLFSLYPNSYVLTENRKGEVKEGYFIGPNRNTASITLAAASDRRVPIPSIGVKTLKIFAKYRVDRLGRLSPVTKETRTWHGKACT